MKRIQLELEHRYKNRFVGRHFIAPNRRRIMGSAKSADLILLGEHVGPVHAAIEYHDGHWVVTDLGSEQGTWIQKNPIVSHEIHEPTEVHIGEHHLRLVPREFERPIFVNKDVNTPPTHGNHHQVIVQKNNYLIETHLLPRHQSFELLWKGQLAKIKPPTQPGWTSQEFGNVVILNRLVSSVELKKQPGDTFSLSDSNTRLAVATSAILAAVGFLLILFAPHRPTGSLNIIRPEINIYTKMIYDAKLMAEKRKEAIRQKKYLVGQSRIAPQSNNTGNSEESKVVRDTRDSGAQGAKVISQIKAKQLGALIGKISKRAALNSLTVLGRGLAPENAKGRAGISDLLTTGSLVDSKIPGPGQALEGQKIGRVNTSGKGGGSAQYKGLGGLTMGNVGNASVGILEEETEIDGGLDREVIARVIQSELGQIRYCYERQLSASPNLFGKVQVKFTIGPDGHVTNQSIGNTTLQSAMVEGCILRRVAGWQFPQPKGGTQVLVSYPFIFRSTR